MTIVFALANSEYVIQLSDRRLSTPSAVVTNEANKAAIIFNGQARLALGFTGIARVGQFDVFSWILDELFAAGPPDYGMNEILERFIDALNSKFQALGPIRNTPREQRGLSLLFSGFVDIAGNKGSPGFCRISNCANTSSGETLENISDEFNVTFLQNKRSDALLVERIGNWRGITAQDLEKLTGACRQHLPPDAVVQIGFDVVKSLATRKKSGHTIGQQITGIVIPADINEHVVWTYSTAYSKNSVPAPAMLWMFEDKQMLAKNVRLSAGGEADSPLVVPKVHRNAPCPCGSRIRYRNCHALKAIAPIEFSPDTLILKGPSK